MAGSGFENSLLYANNADFSNSPAPANANGINADNQIWLGRSAISGTLSQIDVMTLTAGAGITLTRAGAGVPGTPGTLTIANAAGATDLHVARFIVSGGILATDGANFATIATAYAAAVAAGGRQTVFIQPGTYTENLTLSANVNLCAFDCDASTPTVTIIGTLTANFTGSMAISGINLQTNGSFVLTSTTVQSTSVSLVNCVVTATNSTAINCSNTSGAFSFRDGGFEITNTGIAVFQFSGGNHVIQFMFSGNAGNSVTANTISAGSLVMKNTQIQPSITTSGTAELQMVGLQIGNNRAPQNVTCLTAGGSGVHKADSCTFIGGTASTISVGNNLTLAQSTVLSSNTNAITGAGTLTYGNVTFNGTTNLINTTTTAGLYSDEGKYVARKQPAFLATGSGVAQTNITGNNTIATINYATEVFDQDNNYDGTNTFTAPITGRYSFSYGISMTQVTGGTTGVLHFVASNRSIINPNLNFTAIQNASGNILITASCFMDMDAADTAIIRVQINGIGADTADTSGSTNQFFSGFLVC